MRVKKFSEIQNNFTKTANELLRDHVPVIITGNFKQPVVMLSLEDFNSYEETFYLTKNPTNHKRLMASVENVKNGKYQHRALIEHEAN
jgi:antitoxin YefM